MKRKYRIFIFIGVVMLGICSLSLLNVIANTNNTRIIVQSSNSISIDEQDTNKLIYKIGNTIVGTVKLKKGNNYIAPAVNGNKIEYLLDEYSNTNYNVIAEVTAMDGYQRGNNYFSNGISYSFSDDNTATIVINANNIFNLDFSFSEEGSLQQPIADVPMYPIVAYFNGVSTGVEMNSNGSIIMPENWTNGHVTFKAKIYTLSDGTIVPDDGNQTGGIANEVPVAIEGIANSSQINNTVTGDREYINISNNFREYGKVTLHIVGTENGSSINTIVDVISNNLVNLRATAPIDMSYSVGSSAVDQAIVTKDEMKDVSIFFGNNKATLIASGPNVLKITKVNNNDANVTLNNDGTATLNLPDLSVETTTKAKVTILMNDGSSIVRTININRTAVMLEFDSRTRELRAGYVMNKGYLYNNQMHNDLIFNAYLQVILYKDNMVAGYKQVKIDDEAVINRLGNNKAWSIETFDSDNPIILYSNIPSDITGAGVFLTNGPIDGNSNKLPSIEFGIGSGVQISWGVK